MNGNHGVLVGYDGSASSREALSWAARAARERDVVLTVCHAWTPGDADSARWILSTAVQNPDPARVRQILVPGRAASVLCELSAEADVLVVGCRGLSGLSGLMLGSVSLQVAALASAPVVVVRGRWRSGGGYLPGHIVAGIDGSQASVGVLTFAGAEAALRHLPLTAVCAQADAPGELGMAQHIGEDFERIITTWEKDHPEVELHRQITGSSARTALLDAAQDAQLLVVGRRGRGGLPRMVLGTVAQTLLSYAPCPVAVVGPR
jgi:nucleotide-binding universal stress UspA family protein